MFINGHCPTEIEYKSYQSWPQFGMNQLKKSNPRTHQIYTGKSKPTHTNTGRTTDQRQDHGPKAGPQTKGRPKKPTTNGRTKVRSRTKASQQQQRHQDHWTTLEACWNCSSSGSSQGSSTVGSSLQALLSSFKYLQQTLKGLVIFLAKRLRSNTLAGSENPLSPRFGVHARGEYFRALSLHQSCLRSM